MIDRPGRKLAWGAVLVPAMFGLASSCSSTSDVAFTSGVAATGSSNGGAGGAGQGGANTGGFTLGTGGASDDSGCNKVDFLFVIDNSVSMGDQQAALISSFPGFIAAIQATLKAGSDYHVMVTDSDDETRCTPANCQSGAMSADTLCIQAAGGYACNATFEECDNIIGAGVLHPAGEGASNEPCEVFGGNRYIVQGEPKLNDAFACVAQVGLAGHPSERPMDSLVAAMSDELNGADGCNDGFLRDDAILVITFVSDDPWYEDQGEPQDWYDAVVAAKGGNADAVAVLGLTPNFDGCQDDKGPPKGSHWSEFVTLWGDRGLEASVCNLDYTGFFEQAIAIIDETCDEFDPPS